MWAAVYSQRVRSGPELNQQLLALALFDLALELLDDLGHRLTHPGELPVLDLDHPQARGGGDGGGALLLLQQALLPEDVARAEVADLLPVPLDPCGALLDREEVIGVPALLDDHLTLRELVGLRERRDLAELFVGDLREQWNGLQQAYVQCSLLVVRAEPNRWIRTA